MKRKYGESNMNNTEKQENGNEDHHRHCFVPTAISVTVQVQQDVDKNFQLPVGNIN